MIAKNSSTPLRTNKILIICGPTASGKSSLALKVANLLAPASIINVDSRQAYQGLPILTGQDILPNFICHTTKKIKYLNQPAVYFESAPKNGSEPVLQPSEEHLFSDHQRSASTYPNSVRIWGIDQVPPVKNLNLSNFTSFVWQVIKKETEEDRKIIITGGTGLYLKAITKSLQNIHVGFNFSQRKKLSKLSTEKLQEKLKKLNLNKYNKLNQSDKQNPRRLIRAIEISLSQKPTKPDYFSQQKNTIFLWIGLRSNLKKLKGDIRRRVIKRLKSGVIKEFDLFQKTFFPTSQSPIFSSLGLNLISKYQEKKITKTELKKLWIKADLSYAKRQLTWFKKQVSIIWYDKSKNQERLAIELASWLKNKSTNEKH